MEQRLAICVQGATIPETAKRPAQLVLMASTGRRSKMD